MGESIVYRYNITSCVMNGGYSTGYFDIKRGAEGDPLSPYLFLLAMEIVAHKVKQDNSIKGFRIGDYEISRYCMLMMLHYL